MKKLLVLSAIIAPLTFGGTAVAHAVTGTPSDYSQDVAAGEKQLAGDKDAQQQATDVTIGETIGAHVDDGDVQVDVNIDDQESEMDAGEAGEVQHGEADPGADTTDQSSDTSATGDTHSDKVDSGDSAQGVVSHDNNSGSADTDKETH